MQTGYTIRSGSENMDVDAVHEFLSKTSYWAKHIPLCTVKEAINNSYCVGVFDGDQQIAFARLVTDYCTFAYLGDVYVLESYRGKGISKAMMQHLMELDWVKGLRRIILATLDAQSLYASFGFSNPPVPERIMEIRRSDIYGDKQNPC